MEQRGLIQTKCKVSVGDTFGYLTTVELIKGIDGKKNKWKCRCKCGNFTNVYQSNLTRGHTRSCGCYATEYRKRRKDIVGKRFGRLTVLKMVDDTPNMKSPFLCVCDCGKEKVVSYSNLVSGNTRSCGCLFIETTAKLAKRTLTTHGMIHTPEYKTWHGIITRCTNEKCISYKYYGGRGITVCDKWRESFVNFYNDMGKKPDGKYSIDRIDVNKGYYKENCRWATVEQQANNMRSNVFVEYKGKRLTLAQLSREIGISPAVIYCRWRNGARGDRLVRPKRRW